MALLLALAVTAVAALPAAVAGTGAQGSCNATVLEGTDLKQGDIGNEGNVATLGACCDLCLAHAGCAAFTYVAHTQHCYMKDTLSPREPNANTTSGLLHPTPGPAPAPTPPQPTPPPTPPQFFPFRNSSLPWEARLDDLIGRLTLEEKGALMGHYDVGDTQYKNLGRATAAGIPRLGIHSYDFGMECNQGMNVGYPQNIGMAATFNRSLLFAAGRGTGIGVRSNANDCIAGLGHCNRQSPGSTSPALSCWSPMINIMRHPLWGRNHEGYGECPYLSGELAAAMVRGMQGDDPRYLLANAGVKHFAAFDGAANGGDAIIDDGDWELTYLRPFAAAFDAGSMSTMCTYASYNGVRGCEDPRLLTAWLRGKKGFTGYVISDQGAIRDATAAIGAGCDAEDGGGQFSQLPGLVRAGLVNESAVDLGLRRQFRVRMLHGEFDAPSDVPFSDRAQYSGEAFNRTHRAVYSNVSLSAARQSLTLLKNSGGFLPISPTTTGSFSSKHRLAVIGIENYTGGDPATVPPYFYTTAPGSEGTPSHFLGELGFDVTVAPGCLDGPACTAASYNGAAVKRAAANATTSLVFIGRGCLEGENRDLKNLSLPGEQQRLVEDVLGALDSAATIRTNPAGAAQSVVLVLLTADPVDISFALDHPAVKAVIHAFYPALWAGRAIAEAVAGVFSPAGRMPYSYHANLNSSGALDNYTMSGTNKTYRYGIDADVQPLFPFGYGLSYGGPFEYSGLTVAPAAAAAAGEEAGGVPVQPCQNVTVTVSVRNTGSVDADEVVQVYASWEPDAAGASASRLKQAPRQLVQFERVHVRAGATVVVPLVFEPKQVAMLDTTGEMPPTPDPSADFHRIRACAGNSSDGKCGTLAGRASFGRPMAVDCEGGWGGCFLSNWTTALEDCCSLCDRTTPGVMNATAACAAWEIRWQWPRPICTLHDVVNSLAIAGRARGSSAGVVFQRMPKEQLVPCGGAPPPSPPPAPRYALPEWVWAPGKLRLWVGGQQPRQKTAAPSNVLQADVELAGPATPLEACSPYE